MICTVRGWEGRLESGSRKFRLLAGTGALLLCLAAGVALAGSDADDGGGGFAAPGEARRGAATLALPEALGPVRVTEARVPGRPLVVIDPGHGGRDPGASGAATGVREKQLTLLIARELHDRLAERGRVRIAFTRQDDRTLDLQQRADIARRLGADLFLSIHADSAANPLARGATVYSLSDVASDADAARFAAAQNGGEPVSTAAEPGARALLADLAARDQMGASADFAVRLLDDAKGRVELRPEPHRFAAFRVLRGAEAPAVLFEAGYLSNAEDEAMLLDPKRRKAIVDALARSIETEMALRSANR